MVVLLTPDLAVWVSSVAQGYCAAFLEKTCYSHGASLHQGVLIGNGELLVRGGGGETWTSIPASSNTPCC